MAEQSEALSDWHKERAGRLVLDRMLERPRLLILPCAASEEENTSRALADAATGERLGMALWRPAPFGRWLAWLATQHMEVLETEDRSLLMTVRRPWGPGRMWDVYDAEERRVGRIFRAALFEAHGHRLAFLRTSADRGPGRFVTPRGQELATLEMKEDRSALLAFTASDTDPFTRMVVLGGVLVALGT